MRSPVAAALGLLLLSMAPSAGAFFLRASTSRCYASTIAAAADRRHLLAPSLTAACLGDRRGAAALTTMAAGGQGNGHGQGGKIGFIGLGYMGSGMVRRLLGRGDDIIVWNRSSAKSQLLKEEYEEGRVTVAASPKEVLEKCGGHTFSMLSTPQAARDVFFAPDGVLAGMKPGKALVDCATLEVKDMQEFEQAVKGKGGRFLEAPVSGSKVPAEQGQLIFLAAGSQGLFNDVGPQFEAMGKASFYLGETGKGTEMKLVVNMVMSCMLASLSEGITLAGRSGLSKDDLLKILSLGAMASPMITVKGPKIVADEHTPNFPLKHAQKDLAFSLALARQLGVEPPKTAVAANEHYKKALELGDGELDFSAVAHAIEAAAAPNK